MTGDGSEYNRGRREVDEDETERIVREMIEEVRKEIEERELSEVDDISEEVKDPEQVVREAIEEILHEEEERLRAQEAWEEQEREKEEQLEESREERLETADKDDFAELEERILENFDEYGIDPEEVKERWRERFEEEVTEELGEPQHETEQTDKENEENEQEGDRTAEDEIYYTDSSGQVHVVKTESDEAAGYKTESSSETQEEQLEPSETSESTENTVTESNTESGEIVPAEETASQISEEDMEHSPVRERGEAVQELESESTPVEDIEQPFEKERVSRKENCEESQIGSSSDHDEVIEQGTIQDAQEEVSASSENDIEEAPEKVQEPHEVHETEDVQDSHEESESREEEIWREYEDEYNTLEDEAWRQYLREVFDEMPEEEQEHFRECVRDEVETIDDFEELVRKHGLDELLEDEEVMEEVRTYLELRHRLEDEPEADIEELAEELRIDVDLAQEWSRGESKPYSLKKLLDLEAFYLWDEILRTYREQNLPQSREELEKIMREDSQLREDRLFVLERDDAIAWIEIMAMRRRGAIQKRIRNGREIYSRKQIMELSEKYSVSAGEIIRWLRGERIPPLLEKLQKVAQKKSQPKSDIERQLQRVYRLHSRERFSEREIASRLGISRNQVQNALRDWEVHERYYVQKQTLSLIASEMGLTIIKLRAILKKYGWSMQIQTERPRPSVEEIQRLHLEDGLTYIQIASRTGLQMNDIRDAIGAQKGQTTSEEIYILYFKEGYSFEQICDILGISMKTIRRTFRKNKWEFRKATITKQLDEKWIHHLYYIEGFSHYEIAGILGVHTATIHKLFHDQKWISRERRTVPIKGDIDLKRREYQRNRRQKLKETRVQVFGTKCYACGSEKKPKKNLHLHRKDGSEHSRHLFRTQKRLESLTHDEWVPLCDRCHLGITLLMKSFRFDWRRIESFLKERKAIMGSPKEHLQLPNDDAPVSQEYAELNQEIQWTIDDLKKLIFGRNCSLCGSEPKNGSLILHRKDGKVHSPLMTSRKKHFQKLKSEEWVHVCSDCHNIAHWALEKLGIDWPKLCEIIFRINGGSGET